MILVSPDVLSSKRDINKATTLVYSITLFILVLSKDAHVLHAHVM